MLSILIFCGIMFGIAQGIDTIHGEAGPAEPLPEVIDLKDTYKSAMKEEE